jgi:hypothetical protein
MGFPLLFVDGQTRVIDSVVQGPPLGWADDALTAAQDEQTRQQNPVHRFTPGGW